MPLPDRERPTLSERRVRVHIPGSSLPESLRLNKMTVPLAAIAYKQPIG
jgi:hypothetical protein